MSNTLLINGILENKGFQKKGEIDSLVKILARSSILPKIDQINIVASETEPDIFKIIPGRSITIGTTFLKNPTISLLCLRYGIEWQIWFNASGRKSECTLLCDLAALKVTSQFYSMLPPVDRKSSNDNHPFINQLIEQNKKGDIDIYKLKPEILKTLDSVHNLNYSEKKIDQKWVDILDNLAKPTEIILMSGGDVRLNIDEQDLLNVYGCRPFPRPEAFTFASSTATSISNFAYNEAEQARVGLIESSLKNGIEEGSLKFSKKLKSRLLDVFELKSDNEIIFSPSGTDSSLQIGAMMQVITEKEITHILVASDETGSGVSLALSGSHFANSTALGHEVSKGERIKGFREVNVVNIPLRDFDGTLKNSDDLDEEVYQATKSAHDKGHYVILHVIDQSKLGYQAPSLSLIEKVKQINHEDLQIVIDASQLRIDAVDINSYLDQNYIMTITGSKYFTGPPFSGALILPKNVKESLGESNRTMPIGLNEYFNKFDWPIKWTCVTPLADGFNYGAFMRWNAALSEMKRYYATPLTLRNLGIEQFCNYVEESIYEAPFLEQLFVNEFKSNTEAQENEIRLRNIRSIFPFFILKDKKVLSFEKTTDLYRLLNKDISDSFADEPLEVQRIASQKCHIGQPVKVKYSIKEPSAVVRISLGARIISDSWKDRDASMFFRKIDEQMNQVNTVIRKIELILNHPNLLS